MAGVKRCFRNGGQIYFGEVEEAADGTCLRHGLGLQLFTARPPETAEDGQAPDILHGRYQGAWRKGQLTGSGVYHWSDGTVYEGYFLDGRPHGYGRIKWPEGTVYDGDWNGGEMHGQGTYICGFTNLESHGIFWHNCLRNHAGQWVNKVQEREALRQQHLKINAYPSTSYFMPVIRCRGKEILSKALSMSQEPPFLVPFLLAKQSYSAGPEVSLTSPPPLCCAEADIPGARGCTFGTSIHISHVAAEKRRVRHTDPLFQKAIQTALVESRPFALIWPDDEKPASPFSNHQLEVPVDIWDLENAHAVPKEWCLDYFFDKLVLPTDIFDPPHFQCSSLADAFLPESEVQSAFSRDACWSKDTKEPAHPEMQPPPVLHTLRTLLISLRKVPNGAEDESIRKHMLSRFGSAVPLHRIAVLVAE